MTDCINSKIEDFDHALDSLLKMLVRDLLNEFEFEAINRLTIEKMNFYVQEFIATTWFSKEFIPSTFTARDILDYCEYHEIDLYEADKLVYAKNGNVTLLKDGIIKFILQGLKHPYCKQL